MQFLFIILVLAQGHGLSSGAWATEITSSVQILENGLIRSEAVGEIEGVGARELFLAGITLDRYDEIGFPMVDFAEKYTPPGLSKTALATDVATGAAAEKVPTAFYRLKISKYGKTSWTVLAVEQLQVGNGVWRAQWGQRSDLTDPKQTEFERFAGTMEAVDLGNRRTRLHIITETLLKHGVPSWLNFLVRMAGKSLIRDSFEVMEQEGRRRISSSR